MNTVTKSNTTSHYYPGVIYRKSPIFSSILDFILANFMQKLLFYLWDSLVTLELISLILLVGTPETDPLAVKLLDNRLFMNAPFKGQFLKDYTIWN